MDTLLHLSSVRPGDGGMSIVHRPVPFPAHYLVKRRGPAREAVKGHSDKKPAATGEDAEKNVFVTVANAAGCNRYTDGQEPYPYFPGTVHFSTTPIPPGKRAPVCAATMLSFRSIRNTQCPGGNYLEPL
jgi:hypothetical protein